MGLIGIFKNLARGAGTVPIADLVVPDTLIVVGNAANQGSTNANLSYNTTTNIGNFGDTTKGYLQVSGNRAELYAAGLKYLTASSINAITLGDAGNNGNGTTVVINDSLKTFLFTGQTTFLGGLNYNIRVVADAIATLTAVDYFLAITTVTANRNITFPSAATVGAGATFVVKSNSAAVLATYLTMVGVGGDTFDLAANSTITTPYGSKTYTSDGVSNWFVS